MTVKKYYSTNTDKNKHYENLKLTTLTCKSSGP